MAATKGPAMRRTGASVAGFVAAVPDEQRRQDAQQLCALMQQITAEPSAMWEPASSVSAPTATGTPAAMRATRRWRVSHLRAQHLAIYLVGGFETRQQSVLARLGPHKTGKGCLYLKRLDDVDHGALRELIDRSARVHKRIDRSRSRKLRHPKRDRGR
jgi:Domain of unknown function (DU1801)